MCCLLLIFSFKRLCQTQWNIINIPSNRIEFFRICFVFFVFSRSVFSASRNWQNSFSTNLGGLYCVQVKNCNSSEPNLWVLIWNKRRLVKKSAVDKIGKCDWNHSMLIPTREPRFIIFLLLDFNWAIKSHDHCICCSIFLCVVNFVDLIRHLGLCIV